MLFQGALFGSVIGVIFSLWIGLGSIIHGKSPVEDNLPVGQCLDNNRTVFDNDVQDGASIVDGMLLNQTNIMDNVESR